MKLSNILLITLPIIILGCKSELDIPKEEVEIIKNESTTEQNLNKHISIEAFENGNSIGKCDYQVTLIQTIIGKDSIWVISDLNEGISKKPGFFFYSSPEKLMFIKSDEGYDIHLTLECQLSALESQLEDSGEEEIGFTKIFDVLNDNESNITDKDSLMFYGKGSLCIQGNHIRLIKTLRIYQKNNQLTIVQDELKIITSSGYDGGNYEFLESNNFPEQLDFEKSAGYQPL